MKKIMSFRLVILIVLIQLFTSCKKNETLSTNPNTVPVTLNSAPLANAGRDSAILLPVNSVLLDGSASADKESNIVSYSWKLVSGPSTLIVISNPDSVKTMVQNLLIGVYQFELSVSDKGGLSSKDTMQVLVLDSPNNPPVARAGNDMAISLPINFVFLDGSHSTDPENNIAGYSWKLISGTSTQIIISNPDSAKTKALNFVSGIYFFELTVTDKVGISSKDTMYVSVFSAPTPNNPPVARAGDDMTIALPIDFVFVNAGNSTDPENNIATILWRKIAGPSSINIEQPDSLSTKLSNLKMGAYQFELTVTDSMGMYGKDTILITVMGLPHDTIILENLVWRVPWYNTLEVMNFYELVPQGIVFRVFIKRDWSPEWGEAYPVSTNGTDPYEYFVETRPGGGLGGNYQYGRLYVFYYGTDISDTPDIKLVY